MTLITTPGAADANSFVSLVEAVDYIATLTFASAWPSTDSAREAVLIQAARKINTLDLKGTRVKPEASQPLAFPRSGIYDRDGWVIDANTIPNAVKVAQVELALWLAASDRNPDPSPSRLKVGSIEIEGLSNQSFPDHVLAFLAPFLKSYGNNIALVRG